MMPDTVRDEGAVAGVADFCSSLGSSMRLLRYFFSSLVPRCRDRHHSISSGKAFLV